MALRFLTRIYWESAAETTIGYAASGASAVLSLHLTGTSVPWYTVASGAGVGALAGFLKALSSLQVQPSNGNSSYLRRIVAKP